MASSPTRVASASYLAAHDLAVIRPLALWAPGLTHDGPNLLRSPGALERFLARDDVYPLFGKPAEGFQSLGSVGLRRRAGGGLIETIAGGEVPIERLVADIVDNYADGYVFQRYVSPHPAMAPLSAGRLGTVRFVTLAGADGPSIVAACAKLIAGDNVADNYWRGGNLLAGLDAANGAILRVVSAIGFDLAPHERHPDSGVPFAGARLPLWNEMRELALAGARLMRHIPLIGWDIAATEEGAIIVEMNEMPDFTLPQLADAKGVLGEAFDAARAYQRDGRRRYRKSLRASTTP